MPNPCQPAAHNVEPDDLVAGRAFSRRLRDRAMQILRPQTPLARRLLIDRLVHLPNHAGFIRRHAPGVPKSIKVRKLKAIGAAADRLSLALVGTTRTGENPELAAALRPLLLWEFAEQISPRHPERAITDGRADRMLREHLRAVSAIANAAGRAARSVEPFAATNRGGIRHTEDRAVETVIDYLIVAYRMVTGREPTAPAAAHSDDGADSRFLQFAKLCFDGLDWRISVSAIRGHFRRMRAAETAQKRASPSVNQRRD